MWTGLLGAVLLLSVHRAIAAPGFLVTFPAVIPADSQAKVCASLLYPNETLHMSIFLKLGDHATLLLEKKTNEAFYQCFHFQAPAVEKESIQSIRVEVRGESFQMMKDSSVMFKPYSEITFIQTDKPVYKPGQTVHFRIVTLDTQFAPVIQLYSTVELRDVHQNRIGQWTNVSTNGRILQLSHPLSSEAPLGTYTLSAAVGETRTQHSFKVKEYVLPRFEVKVNAPSEVNVAESELKIEVCGKYTYGQAVPGKAELELCRNKPWVSINERPCHTQSVQLDKIGCGSHVFNMSYFHNLDSNFQGTLAFNAKVEEQGTGVILQESAKVRINNTIGRVKFVETPSFYDPGSNIEGKIQVVDFKDLPVVDMPVYLYRGYWSSDVMLNLTTDQHGMASFSLNMTDHNDHLNLRASCYGPNILRPSFQNKYYEDARQAISPLQPVTVQRPSVSSVVLQNVEQPLACGKVAHFTGKYVVVGEKAQDSPLYFFYLVMSRGSIVHHGSFSVAWHEGPLLQGEVSFELMVDPEMSPVLQVLVYSVLPSGNVIAGNKDFETEKCFKHKVSLEFSPPRAVPAEQGTLKVTAQPGALCGLSSVDQSVLLLEPNKQLDADKIFSLLPVQKTTHVPYTLKDSETCLHVRTRRYVIPHRNDALRVFTGLGLKTATNFFITMPHCLLFKGQTYHYTQHYDIAFSRHTVGLSGRVFDPSLEHQPIETVRTFFPETWIWDLVEVGESGSTEVPITVPDTITTWEAEAFCLSPVGLGLAPSTQLTVFQPFFLELTLPYSIIRGERFELKATVFNYLPKCIMVLMTAAPSSDYKLEPHPGSQYSSCLCASETKTFQWGLVASALGAVNVTVSAEAVPSQTECDNEVVSVPEKGRIDRVTRALLVKAEGMEKTDSHSWLLCPKGEEIKEEVKLELPENVVEGSARGSVSVIGDILGRALQNLEGLLAMPYGCGEQNMALLAPNIYILHYLEATGQLTSAISEKATPFLKSGYQRQLNYKHPDGAFSTFGTGSGNTWLTAFVAKSFVKAQTFVFIDPTIVEQAQTWLLKNQKPDGCFNTVGKLFNNRMKGGVADDVTLTAYITAAFLESKTSHSALNNSLACLRSDTSYLTNTYTSALLAYTFSLAGDHEKRDELLEHLHRLALEQGGLLHWSQSTTEMTLSVEISSYVLLAVLNKSPLTAEDMGYAVRIVRWMAGQQNSYGGFSSTQDTVVALQALALFSTLAHTSEGSSTVTVQSTSGEQHRFLVDQGNRLLYQERALKDVTGQYSIAVQGTSCASVQTTLRYNIPTPAVNSTFSVAINVSSECKGVPRGEKVILKFSVEYNGLLESTNMVLVDIKVLSGFVPDPLSLTQLKRSELVERVDSKGDHIEMYLKELTRNIPKFYKLQLQQELKVKNLKAAVIKMYDYYQPSDYVLTEYSSPCADHVGNEEE
ncbi:alpha-2-macroglobulin-like [Scleropages formosus]|uniref:alpha-2-macroglobulin-like n=1 Tax=Scleropages formosus TaxID=113540 RepID=UPI0010FACCBF|nr:alpha-2-macroglobulin-like [Scleropages formosus]